jgi:hypothetical protein
MKCIVSMKAHWKSLSREEQTRLLTVEKKILVTRIKDQQRKHAPVIHCVACSTRSRKGMEDKLIKELDQLLLFPNEDQIGNLRCGSFIVHHLAAHSKLCESNPTSRKACNALSLNYLSLNLLTEKEKEKESIRLSHSAFAQNSDDASLLLVALESVRDASEVIPFVTNQKVLLCDNDSTEDGNNDNNNNDDDFRSNHGDDPAIENPKACQSSGSKKHLWSTPEEVDLLQKTLNLPFSAKVRKDLKVEIYVTLANIILEAITNNYKAYVAKITQAYLLEEFETQEKTRVMKQTKSAEKNAVKKAQKQMEKDEAARIQKLKEEEEAKRREEEQKRLQQEKEQREMAKKASIAAKELKLSQEMEKRRAEIELETIDRLDVECLLSMACDLCIQEDPLSTSPIPSFSSFSSPSSSPTSSSTSSYSYSSSPLSCESEARRCGCCEPGENIVCPLDTGIWSFKKLGDKLII